MNKSFSNFFGIILFFLVFLSGFNLSDGAELNWKTYKYDEVNCSIDSPFPLEIINVKYDKYKEGIVHSVLVGSKNKSFLVMLGGLSFKQKKINNLEDLRDDDIRSVEKPNIFSDFKLISKPTTYFGDRAILTEGTFKMSSAILRKIKLLTIAREKSCWHVRVYYDVGNLDQEKMADRVIKSFKILK